MADLPNRLKELRKARGLSQEALAERVGATKQQISKIERGVGAFTFHWAGRLATALDCYPSELMAEADVRPAEIEYDLLFDVIDTCLGWLDDNADWLDRKGYKIDRRQVAQSMAQIYDDMAREAPGINRGLALDRDSATILRFAARSA